MSFKPCEVAEFDAEVDDDDPRPWVPKYTLRWGVS